jgi:hypothetical protein
MPFKLANKEIGFVKASMFGPKGTGKTTMMAMFLIHLSKTYHNSAPVAWLASEKGVDFVLDMFKAEGVPLLLNRSRSFLDLRNASKDALSEGACAIGVDSVSHFWQDLFTAGMRSSGPRLARIGKIKDEWAPFAQDFQDSAIHWIVTGRMGFIWDEVEMPDENGNMQKELSKGGTKIKAEGDFGHEPDLEIETAQMDDPDLVRFDKIGGRARRNFKSQMIHVATVKKCRVWSLNGRAFTWKDQTAYKVGYYQKVAEPFKEYFDSLGIGGSHAVTKSERTGNSSAVLFNSGSEHSAHEASIQRKCFLEELDNLLAHCFPGGEKRSKIDAMHRNLTLEFLNGFSSWSRMEEEVPTINLKRNVLIITALRKRIDADEKITDQASLAALLHLASDDVLKPGHGVTLTELMLAKSVEAAKPKGPQPIVPIMDNWPNRELAGD